ncbi:MAG TPA: cell wall-active antibiotics response protein LiaF [Virgibacillus sp.]|nr:cell wall-active antibiotics response protein LiaF [Virgibacillus sp.]
MFRGLSTDTLNWIIIIGVILFIVEIAFFHGGMIVSALLCAVLIYVGWKNYTQLWGKIIFWLGIVGLILSILNMLAVRFLIVAAIVLFLMNYYKSKQEKEDVAPDLQGDGKVITDPVVNVEPLFTHKIFGDQKTDGMAYQWRDVNIHGVFGDRVIDLSNTVLPDDTAIISIRHIIGDIEIYIPYEVEVSIHHSSIFGRAHIFGEHHWNLFNQTFHYQTLDYDQTKRPRIKIITSLFSGNIEVRRI